VRFNGRLSRSTIFLALLLGGLAAAPVPAQILGPEFQVNSHTTDTQWGASVAADAAGNFVVAWMSDEQDGSSWGIFGQRYDAAGLPAGGEFRVNEWTAAHQMAPGVAYDTAGNLVVIWSGYRVGQMENAYARRFGPDGQPLGGEFQINSYTPFGQSAAGVAPGPDGGFLILWNYSEPSGQFGHFGRRYDADGLPVAESFTIDPIGVGPSHSIEGIALREAGEFVAAGGNCTYENREYSCEVEGRRLRDGVPLGDPFPVNTYTTGIQWNADLAADAAGNFVVVWQSHGQDPLAGIFGRRFSAQDQPLGGEFHVNSATADWQTHPAVAVDPAGGFLVVWESEGQDGSGSGIYAQRYSASGARVGGELRVNEFTPGDQQWPEVAATGAGDFVVTWSSEGQDGSWWGVFARRLTSGVFLDGFEAGDACGWSSTVGGGCP
jgi:hypothetical protein